MRLINKKFLILCLFFLSSTTHSSEIDSIHEKCLNANDYEGCVNFLSKKNQLKKDKKENNFLNLFSDRKLKNCINNLKDIKAKKESNFALYEPEYGKIGNDSFKLACNTLLSDKTKSIDFSEIERACILLNSHGAIKSKDSFARESGTPENIIAFCGCWDSEGKHDQAWKSLMNQNIANSCALRENYTQLRGGYRYFDQKFLEAVILQTNTWDYALADYSIVQKRIRKEYGRYLTFYGRTNNPYSGDYIPAKPGYIDCDWGGSGSSYYNEDYGSGSWSSGGYCYGEEGTPERVIPGGVDNKFYKYTLDCLDKTFDRKGDRVNYNSGAMKGWMKINEDPTAYMAATIYCPVINNLPKE